MTGRPYLTGWFLLSLTGPPPTHLFLFVSTVTVFLTIRTSISPVVRPLFLSPSCSRNREPYQQSTILPEPAYVPALHTLLLFHRTRHSIRPFSVFCSAHRLLYTFHPTCCCSASAHFSLLQTTFLILPFPTNIRLDDHESAFGRDLSTIFQLNFLSVTTCTSAVCRLPSWPNRQTAVNICQTAVSTNYCVHHPRSRPITHNIAILHRAELNHPPLVRGYILRALTSPESFSTSIPSCTSSSSYQTQCCRNNISNPILHDDFLP